MRSCDKLDESHCHPRTNLVCEQANGQQRCCVEVGVARGEQGPLQVPQAHLFGDHGQHCRQRKACSSLMDVRDAEQQQRANLGEVSHRPRFVAA